MLYYFKTRVGFLCSKLFPIIHAEGNKRGERFFRLNDPLIFMHLKNYFAARKVDLGMIPQARINAHKEMGERRHRAAEEDRKLQRKKLELEERALALREVTAAAEERQDLLQFLMR